MKIVISSFALGDCLLTSQAMSDDQGKYAALCRDDRIQPKLELNGSWTPLESAP